LPLVVVELVATLSLKGVSSTIVASVHASGGPGGRVAVAVDVGGGGPAVKVGVGGAAVKVAVKVGVGGAAVKVDVGGAAVKVDVGGAGVKVDVGGTGVAVVVGVAVLAAPWNARWNIRLPPSLR
jgi:hypothetical protein